MATSTFRGHPIIWKNDEWFFKDSDKPINDPNDSKFDRPCIKCGKVFEGSNEGDPDPCLGNLPGVNNACCGHGNPDMAYIRFTNGIVIKGFTEVERF